MTSEGKLSDDEGLAGIATGACGFAAGLWPTERARGGALAFGFAFDLDNTGGAARDEIGERFGDAIIAREEIEECRNRAKRQRGSEDARRGA